MADLTHYAVIVFGGDPANEHPDPELRGHGPQLELIAYGSEAFCWHALASWTAKHPLRMWETAEVLARHLSVVQPRPVSSAWPATSEPDGPGLGDDRYSPRPGTEAA